MEDMLFQFVETLDASLKLLQEQVGDKTGFSDLTINQFHYIDAVYGLEGPSFTELAERLGITKPSVTAGINKLAALGLVNKIQSDEDNRVFHIYLTEQGMKLIRAKYQALKEYGKFIERALSTDETEQFRKILTKLVMLFRQG